jgi:hypothetical protein
MCIFLLAIIPEGQGVRDLGLMPYRIRNLWLHIYLARQERGRLDDKTISKSIPRMAIGWLFSIGYLKLSFWKGFLAIIIWPYYLGVKFRGSTLH